VNRYRVLLISPGLSSKKQAGSFKGIANVLPTLGIGYIAAVLEKNGFEVFILDCIGQPMNIDDIVRKAKQIDPDIIGVTATVLTINTAYEIAHKLKEAFPSVPLAIGGPQFCADPEGILEKDIFDIGVMGEGEYTFLEIAKGLRNGSFSPENTTGIIYKKKGKILRNPPTSYISDLDAIPFPARHLYPPLSAYKPVPASYIRKPVGLMVTSRGCPYQCIFCDRAVFGNKFRAHSPKYVVDEIELLMNKFGAKEIRFMDDTFTLDVNRVYAICEEIFRRKIKIVWTCNTRVDRISLDLLKIIKKAGCWQIIYGLESGDERMLRIMKKGVTVENNETAVRLAKQAGLNVRATFVFGMPGETLKSIKNTINFAKRVRLDVVNFFTVILYPGNELYRISKREGKILHDDYEQYTSLIDTKETKLHYVPEGLTEKDLKGAIVDAHRDYYFRPSFILRQSLNIRNLGDIKRYWQAFKAVVCMRKA